ncbi:MAG TPA: UDP-3-O-(3-hydroxymyristoyl)glucosamine N-acyltransferase [Rhizomicrobium sp.]|jgi:UDP-3-O-[3-hydroxymyristoyl] glucosamine N-acyltransferase|nr:UDP-3-O-(3-hydroxymyristoyl)glucosamine N-acyltransferase [Rhizomicrobium sp.]
MADPRFYDNRGPFALAVVCLRAGATLPENTDPDSPIVDLASLAGAGSRHLTFCSSRKATEAITESQAGYCFIETGALITAPALRTLLIRSCSVPHAFAAAARLFYPEHGLGRWDQDQPIHPSAKLEENVRLAPGVSIGPGAEIGSGTMIGPNAVIGRGVMIGRDCEIGSHVGIGFALLGDNVTVLPGAQIGQPGFGVASSGRAHDKIPQLGRVIIQDNTEVGACTTIDRGALGDTVIGEGTKIDNLVQIGHNNQIGRHCIVVAQVGISGSCELGDFVVLGGQVGISDHVRIGDRARLAARSAAVPGEYPGNADYGGAPLRPLKEWRREVAAVALLAKRRKRDRDG